MKGFEATAWFGLYMPAAGDNASYRKLVDTMKEFLSAPSTRDKFAVQGVEPGRLTGHEFVKFVDAEIEVGRRGEGGKRSKGMTNRSLNPFRSKILLRAGEISSKTAPLLEDFCGRYTGQLLTSARSVATMSASSIAWIVRAQRPHLAVQHREA